MSLIHIEYRSKELDITTNITVYLPDFDPYKGPEKYPVLWLLHGTYGNHNDWSRFSRIERHIKENGYKIAAVMPDGADSAYVDMAIGGRGTRYQSYIGKELPKFLRSLFPLSDKREENFIGGLSMGGQGALRLAFTFPEQYCEAIALSSGNPLDYYGRKPDGTMGYHDRLMKCFGSGYANELWNTPADLYYLMKKLQDEGKPLPKLYMACGTEDNNYPHAVSFYEKAKEMGFDVEFHGAPGVHNWKFWDPWIEDAIVKLPVKRVGAAE